MNKVIIIIAAIFFANFTTQANSNVTASNSSKLVQVQIENTGHNATITITDREGIVLHSEDITTESYTASYNMQELPEGNYVLSVSEIEDNNISNTNYELTVQNDVVLLGNAEVETVYFPSFNQKGEYLYLNTLALNTTSSISVEFTDAKNETVHTDRFIADGNDDGRIYSLKGLQAGTYMVTCFVEGQVKESTFQIK